MLSFLFGHLVVSIILGMQHIQAIKVTTLVEDLLFALELWLESIPLDAIDRLPEKVGKLLELKDAKKISNKIFTVR